MTDRADEKGGKYEAGPFVCPFPGCADPIVHWHTNETLIAALRTLQAENEELTYIAIGAEALREKLRVSESQLTTERTAREAAESLIDQMRADHFVGKCIYQRDAEEAESRLSAALRREEEAKKVVGAASALVRTASGDGSFSDILHHCADISLVLDAYVKASYFSPSDTGKEGA